MKIPQRARQVSPINVQVSTPSISAPNEKAFGTDISETLLNVTKATENIAKINYAMQDQRDEIALSTFKSNADLLAKAYVEDIKNVKDIKDIDLKKQQLDKEIEASAKGIVPDNIYNGWKAREGLVFNAELNYATERVRTEKNIEKTKADFAQTTLNFANLRYQAKTPQQAEYYRNQYQEILKKLVTGENQTGVKVFSQEEADKLMFAFDNQYDVTKIQELIYGTPEDLLATGQSKTESNLGNPTQAIKDLDNAKMFKTFTPEERQKWKYEALKQVNALHATSKDEKVSEIELQFARDLQGGNLKNAMAQYDYINNDLAGYATENKLTAQQAQSIQGFMSGLIADPRGTYFYNEGSIYDKAIYEIQNKTLVKIDNKWYNILQNKVTEVTKYLLNEKNENIQSTSDIIALSVNMYNATNQMRTQKRKEDLAEKFDITADLYLKNLKENKLENGKNIIGQDVEFTIFSELRKYRKMRLLDSEPAVADFDTKSVYKNFVSQLSGTVDFANSNEEVYSQYKQLIHNTIVQYEKRKRREGLDSKNNSIMVGKEVYTYTDMTKKEK